MIRLSRKRREHITRGLLATLAGLWLLAAAAPCVVMAQAPACPPDMASHHYPHESQPALDAADNCDALAALNCRLPNPNPPSITLDVPAPMPMLLQTLPRVLDVTQAGRLSSFTRTTVDSPTPLLDRKQSRLLI
ncbi:MAG TPA: hypothetical protein VJB18_08780 [Burkholderiales bacterium]|nr:hypothetical protein [Burkholderiales bacterium]